MTLVSMRPILLVTLPLLLFFCFPPAMADPVLVKAEASHFNLWLTTHVFKFFNGRGTLDLDRKEVKLTCLEETNRSIGGGGGGGGDGGRYTGHVQDFVLKLPDPSTTGEDVLAHLDDLLDPEGPFATLESIVIEHSERTKSGAGLAILFRAHEGAVRGHASFAVSETRDREVILTSHTFEVHQTEVNR